MGSIKVNAIFRQMINQLRTHLYKIKVWDKHSVKSKMIFCLK